MKTETASAEHADVRAQLQQAIACWKGRTRPASDNAPGEVAVQRVYGERWRIYGCTLDLCKALSAIARSWPDKVVSIDHDEDHGTTVIVEPEVYSLVSGVRTRRHMTDEQKSAAAARLAKARGAR